jgi:poly(3-hydroxybutyrate) depolymerase
MGSATIKVLVIALVAGLASVTSGCGGRKPITGDTAGNGGAGIAGTAGSSAAGTTGAAGSATAGASGGGLGGSGGLAGSNGGAAGSSTAGAAGTVDGGATASDGGGDSDGATDAGLAGAIGAGLGFGGTDLTKVVRTIGCGAFPAQALGTLVEHTIFTSGDKAPDCNGTKCGLWSYEREYFLQLPTGYDQTKAYPLVFEAPGCGGKGNNLYALPDLASAVIRVGLSPSVEAAAFSDRAGQGCFDFNDGESSVDWTFYENLYDRLATQVCFDRNRVFVLGSASGGGQLSDQLGCKYAGDANRPIRAMMANTGELSLDPKIAPRCTTKPMAGMWIHENGDTVSPWRGQKVAIARAMQVNGCTLGTGYDDAQFDIFPVADNPDGTCKMIKGCPTITPLVVCLIFGNNHASHPTIANPGFAKFTELFLMPPLLSP